MAVGLVRNRAVSESHESMFGRVVMRIAESRRVGESEGRSVPQPILAAAGRTLVALSGATLLAGTATRPLSSEW
jgi:hypothetical protein